MRVWITLNEPLVLLLGGYLDGQIPPGLADGRAAGLALGNLFAAHAAAAAAVRDVAPRAAIGVAHNMMDFVPARPAWPLDRLLAAHARRLYNRAFLDAFVAGRVGPLDPPVHAPRAGVCRRSPARSTSSA